jgi:hypothetical protein
MIGLLTGLAIMWPTTTATTVAQVSPAAAPKPAVVAPAPAATPAAKLSEHAQKDIARHRAVAQAHTAAAQCLESGKAEEVCQKELLAACKGLAIGKYCGMKHEH